MLADLHVYGGLLFLALGLGLIVPGLGLAALGAGLIGLGFIYALREARTPPTEEPS